jgi:uncharacterized protein Yka (UPF0111/DUF47 family)
MTLMVEAAQLLLKIFAESGVDTKKQSVRISEINDVCQGILQRTSEDLRHSFMNSIDREDIYVLMTSLTNVVRQLERLASSEEPTQQCTPEMLAVLNLLHELVCELDRIIPEVSRPAVIRQRLLAINAIRKRGRELCHEALRGLFQTSSNLQEVMIRRDLYHNLESIVTRCWQAGTLVERIAIKNA